MKKTGAYRKCFHLYIVFGLCTTVGFFLSANTKPIENNAINIEIYVDKGRPEFIDVIQLEAVNLPDIESNTTVPNNESNATVSNIESNTTAPNNESNTTVANSLVTLVDNGKKEIVDVIQIEAVDLSNAHPTTSYPNKLRFPSMVKAVTYQGRGNPMNFWDQRFEEIIDNDFRTLLAEGFNSIILLVPWAGVQTTVVPPVYSDFMLEQIQFVLSKAVMYNLKTIFRVSYPHSSDPNNIPIGTYRCETVMKDVTPNAVMEAWLDYMRVLNDLFTKPEYQESYLYSFVSWEDFFCLLWFSQWAPDDLLLPLSKKHGYDKYLKEQYTSNELAMMFPNTEPGEYAIPKWDIHLKPYASYIDFVDYKWWNMVQAGRKVHPNLSMEVRVDIEADIKAYDLHLDDDGPPRQAYFGYRGLPGLNLTAKEGLEILESMLIHSTGNGSSPIILGQFNFQDNTPDPSGLITMTDLQECTSFLEGAADILKRYTVGYGLWGYRNNRQSEIFNGFFKRGLEGWSSVTSGNGMIHFEKDSSLLFISVKQEISDDLNSYVEIQQAVRQLPPHECDNNNNEMELCFRYKMKIQDESHEVQPCNPFHILWNKTKVHEVECVLDWTEKCVRLPALEVNIYPVGFLFADSVSLNIDNIEFSCHTHKMYIRSIDNRDTLDCWNGVINLNQLLS